MSTKSNTNKSAMKVISKEQLIDDFRRIGLRKGETVAVTLSLKSIGHVKGGPDEFINALIDVVGPNGTVMVNTFTHTFPISSVPMDYVFDSESTPSYTGIVCETLRKREDAIRSKHPACSVAAIGKEAEYLVGDHDEKSERFLPYSKLAEIDGKYLCIGIGDRLVAIRHEAQYRAGLSDIVPCYTGVKYKTDNKEVKLFISKRSGCVIALPKLVPDLKERGILKIGKIGMAKAYVASAKELIDSMTMKLKEKPELNLCDSLLCIWCRELERRMNLYNHVENARIFQRNRIIVKIITLINGIRLSSCNLLSYRKGNGERPRKTNFLQLYRVLALVHILSLTLKRKLH